MEITTLKRAIIPKHIAIHKLGGKSASALPHKLVLFIEVFHYFDYLSGTLLLDKLMNQPDALILEMQNGNHQAFSQIYSKYSRAIYGVILPIVREENLAEEVLQDVFVKVWNNSNSYSIHKGRFYTWLLNIARNAAIDTTRSKAFKNSSKNLTTENFVDILAGHDNLSKRTDTIGLKKYVAALKPVCIQIIDLLYFKGYTQAETAKTLETPLGTIKTRARNCIGALRKMLLTE